ncbi:TIR domain-containing protein [candidate division KSB1 bacterium]|nr:TIR domain-containing protein [candidate division KSB1 bacterium]
MPDICIFYSKDDKQRVDKLGQYLKSFGWDVWWYDYNSVGKWNSLVESKTKNSKCVIPIWSKISIDPDKIVVNEARFASDHNIPIIPVRFDDVVLPTQFNLENTTDLFDWDGENHHQALEELTNKLTQSVGLQKEWDGTRPTIINLMGKQVKLPCFVKSLSSHETQLDPEAGLITISLFPEVGALLVSAYDMHLPSKTTIKAKRVHRSMCKQLNNLCDRGALILLDSGNYEKSRKNDPDWNKNKFEWVLRNVPYSFAFCYDNLKPSHDPKKNALDVISKIKGKYENILIPILHAPIENKIRNYKLLPDIFYEYASRKSSPFIAVPERELGDGICEKAKTIMKIRDKLNTLNRYQLIHILGTGNPLSLLILSAAGADLFDGLEWCRTVADRNTGFLFHHQHFELFKHQTVLMAEQNIIKDAMNAEGPSLIMKMGLHNIDFFNGWMDEIRFYIESKRVKDLIISKTRFNEYEFVGEIQELIPGLFK